MRHKLQSEIHLRVFLGAVHLCGNLDKCIKHTWTDKCRIIDYFSLGTHMLSQFDSTCDLYMLQRRPILA